MTATWLVSALFIVCAIHSICSTSHVSCYFHIVADLKHTNKAFFILNYSDIKLLMHEHCI